MGDKIRLLGLFLGYIANVGGAALLRKLHAIVHRWTYKGPSDTPRTVVVVGASFAGVQLMQRLADMLPTGWQVVLVEPNACFNLSFYLPRFSVVPGYERTIFIPYDAILAQTLPGIARFVQGEAVALDASKKRIVLASGAAVPYDIAVIATGSAQCPPAKLLGAADRELGCAELRTLQDRIRRARTVAVVGGGAVGVELAADIKTYAKRVAELTEQAAKTKDKGAGSGDDAATSVVDKEVTLVHSRPQLLNRFGARLHEHVAELLRTKLGIKLELGQRPTVEYAEHTPEAQEGGAGVLHYPDGRQEAYDCILLCTGQTPNSALLKESCAGAIADSGEIRVTPTLQAVDADGTVLPDLFALGDVAATGGPKMARAGYFQADIVAANVLALIQHREATKKYKPTVVEASLKLTLGKDDTAMFVDTEDGKSVLLKSGGEREDMDIKKAWKFFFGVKYSEE